MLRIAHVSDLLIITPLAVDWRRIILNKRLTGLANLILHRARVFNPEYLTAVLDAAAENADQLLVTGDITNLSLDSEFAQARQILDSVAKRIEGGCGSRKS